MIRKLNKVLLGDFLEHRHTATAIVLCPLDYSDESLTDLIEMDMV